MTLPWPRRRTVSTKNLAIATRQLAVMLGAGVPLAQCLDLLGSEERDPLLAETLLALRDDIESGASFAAALAARPRVFDELYVGMAAAGEAGGVLHTMLGRLADCAEKSVALRGQVRAAMMYPVAVLLIAAVVVGVILWKVIPTFAELFDGLGAVLPLPTRVVIAASDSLPVAAPVLMIVAGGTAWIGRRWYATPRGRRALDGVRLRLPVIGPLLRKLVVARFCRTLATLLGAGVPILDGLTITAGTSGNAVVADAVRATRSAIEQGSSVAAPLRSTGVFPPMVTQMVGVGEATGSLDALLSKVADFYEAEVDRAVAGFTALLEPVLIALLGAIVGGIVIAMYLPVFDLISRLAG
ncbi:MAG: type II secretion system F family protein [Acidobacteria bacterium]|nr:type II secretion system F family protein [Acidobacteriota bacterium]MYJ05448.1 type II secretion system F family protein [Acidobacteriota bacterium]